MRFNKVNFDKIAKKAIEVGEELLIRDGGVYCRAEVTRIASPQIWVKYKNSDGIYVMGPVLCENLFRNIEVWEAGKSPNSIGSRFSYMITNLDGSIVEVEGPFTLEAIGPSTGTAHKRGRVGE